MALVARSLGAAIPTIGALFLLNFVSATAVGLALPPRRDAATHEYLD